MNNEQSLRLKGFDNALQVLSREDKNTFLRVASCMYSAKPADVVKYDYDVNGEAWHVWESPIWKTVGNDSRTFNEFFSKVDGFTCKFGAKAADDPDWCPLGPDIADIEIVAGKCPKVNGRNCAFCYKNNGGDVAHCMTLGQFKELFDFFPRNLCQIAFGITGYYTNPEFGEMLEYARAGGVIPNYTTNGVDIDDNAIARTLETCGRVAVSCYEGAKEICYGTMKRFGDAAEKAGRKFPCNIHVVLSKATFPHVMSVLQDAKDRKIPNLGAVVVLRMKPVGRASALDCSVPLDMYRQIVNFCLENNVRFGFDSCGAKRVADVLSEIGRTDLLNCIETCESTRMSIYVSQDRKIYPCSFCEQIMANNAIDASNFKSTADFINMWNNNTTMVSFRNKSCLCKESCSVYSLD